MRAGATQPYEAALRDGRPLGFIDESGGHLPLAMNRYLAHADDGDDTVLRRCVGPTLDVGCGPGRIVGALAARGHAALGLDIAPHAVRLTRQRGAAALTRDVFGPVPGEGRWATILLLDGNIGIGGDVDTLLRRVHRLLSPGGSVIAEASTAVRDTDQALTVRFAEAGIPVGPAFRWARVSSDVLVRRALDAAFLLCDYWSAGEREFVRLSRTSAAA